jgi:hypothetical protein
MLLVIDAGNVNWQQPFGLRSERNPMAYAMGYRSFAAPGLNSDPLPQNLPGILKKTFRPVMEFICESRTQE